ncbi:DNA topoisomerase 2, partial [Nowakowskiella sp. JEL0078]
EELEEMVPWFRGFTGEINRESKDKFRSSGIIRKIDDVTVEITELPIRVWTQSYKETLETWVQGTEKQEAWIKEYKEYHTDTLVHFVVTLTEENMAKAEAEGLEKKFKLTSSIATSNMVCFDRENRIRKYESVNEILVDFYDLRLSYYQKRKDYLLNQYTKEWKVLDNKVRFVTEIIQGVLIIQNKKKTVVIELLKTRKYDQFPKTDKKKATENNSDNEEEEDDDAVTKDSGSYDYLLSMPIWNLTMEKVEKLSAERDVKKAQLTELMGTSSMTLWVRDLDAFTTEWD